MILRSQFFWRVDALRIRKGQFLFFKRDFIFFDSSIDIAFCIKKYQAIYIKELLV